MITRSTILLLTATRAATGLAQRASVLCPPADLRRLEAPVTCGDQCGEDRWTIKTLSDRYRSRVRPPAVQTTVRSLARLPAPGRRPPRTRISPLETTIYCLDAYVISWDDQADRDLHL